MAYCAWLLSLNMFLKFICVIDYVRISFPLWLNNIPLYLNTPICLFICWCTFELLWIVLLWTCVYLHWFEYQFSVLLGISLVVELLAYMIILHVTFWAAVKLFSTVTELLYIPTSGVQGFQFLHILTII